MSVDVDRMLYGSIYIPPILIYLIDPYSYILCRYKLDRGKEMKKRTKMASAMYDLLVARQKVIMAKAKA